MRGHYIAYRNIGNTWIRNDDDKCHMTHVEGAYKINMAFYRKLCDETRCTFTVEEEGILEWRKSIVIRGVYKGSGANVSSRGSSTSYGHGS